MQYLTRIKFAVNDLVQSFYFDNKHIKSSQNQSQCPDSNSKDHTGNKEDFHRTFPTSLFVPTCLLKSPIKTKKIKDSPGFTKRSSHTTRAKVESWSAPKSIRSDADDVDSAGDTNFISSPVLSKSKPLFQIRHRGSCSKQIGSEIPEVGKDTELSSSLASTNGKITLSENLLNEEENTRDSQNRIISYSPGALGEGRTWESADSHSLPELSCGGTGSDSSSCDTRTQFITSSTASDNSQKPTQSTALELTASGFLRRLSTTSTNSGLGGRRFLDFVANRRRSIIQSWSITKAIYILSPSLSNTFTKMDHEDLIAELPQIEKLSNQERLRLAHKRRMLQLKRFQQYDKEIGSKKHKTGTNDTKKGSKGLSISNGPSKPGGKRIRFRNSIMLLEAAGRNDVEEVRRLLSTGVTPDVCNEDGLTALHQCCIDDNEEMMKLLLDYGANVNSEDSERWTPLHAAATCGHLHLVKYLIAKGANLLAVNAEGNMPYDICDEEATLDYIESEMAKRGVTQELIEDTRSMPETLMLKDVQNILAMGGELESRDVDAATPLHVAAANGYFRVVELLLDNHVATDVQDKDNWQPIHAAACWGHLDVLELLVQNGADLNCRTRNAETPYAICEDPEIKERIIQLRSEQEYKQKEAANNRRLKRTQSSNSRTQSIRRTSQRDKGLTTKRDTANEAHILMSRENSLKDNSPSPTAADVNGGLLKENNHMNTVETSSEEDQEDVSKPPGAFGRDSIAMIKVESNQLKRLESIHKDAASNNVENVPATINNNLKSSHIKNSNLNSNINSQSKKFAPAIPHPATDTNANLPKPEINPAIDNKVQIGSNGISLSGSRDSLVGVGNGTIDIHVQVTINTNSPSSTLTNGGTTPYVTTGITPGSTLQTPPGTLADLKKHRSLIRTTSNPLNNGVLNDSPPKSYDAPSSPPVIPASDTLKRFVGEPTEIGDYGDGGKKCCVIV